MKYGMYYVALALVSFHVVSEGMQMLTELQKLGISNEDVQKAPSATLFDGSTIKAFAHGSTGLWVMKQKVDGSLAAEFGNQGITHHLPSLPLCVDRIKSTDNDSKILVTSTLHGSDGTFIELLLNINGTSDESFGVNGMKVVPSNMKNRTK
jgi:hypothetical protein